MCQVFEPDVKVYLKKSRPPGGSFSIPLNLSVDFSIHLDLREGGRRYPPFFRWVAEGRRRTATKKLVPRLPSAPSEKGDKDGRPTPAE